MYAMDQSKKRLYKYAEEWEVLECLFNWQETTGGCKRKNSSISAKVRAEGNDLFNQKGHDEATHKQILLLYTKSIAVAVENSEEQALAYSNRSALLLHLRKYKKCLVDIERAYKISKSQDLRKKLELRKKKCFSLLDSDEEKKSVKNFKNDFIHKKSSTNYKHSHYESIQNLVQATLGYKISYKVASKFDFIRSPEFVDIKEKCNKLKAPTLQSPSKMIPNFSDCIKVKYNKNFGRHVVAARDIKPGEILSIEDGLVFPSLDKIYTSCSHCLNFLWTGIPCAGCVYAVYCSEKCKLEAWQQYHDIECSILPLLLCKAFSRPNLDTNLLACRLFIKMVKTEGLENMIEQAKSIDNDKNAHINGFLTNGKFDTSKFRAYYNLMSYSEDEKIPEVDKFGSVGTFLLLKYTQIFKNFENSATSKSFICAEIKKLLIKFKTLLFINGSMVQDINPMVNFLNDPTALEFSDESFGMAINPCSSLINHSCLSNTLTMFCKSRRKIIFAEHPIKKDEQVFTCYGTPLQMPLADRQARLKTEYRFTCKCEPCIDNWIVSNHNFDTILMRNLSDYIKILKEFNEYQQKLKLKKVDHLSLAYSVKFIELAFKHLSNYNATLFFGEYINYLAKVLCKLYGYEIDMPKNCG